MILVELEVFIRQPAALTGSCAETNSLLNIHYCHALHANPSRMFILLATLVVVGLAMGATEKQDAEILSPLCPLSGCYIEPMASDCPPGYACDPVQWRGPQPVACPFGYELGAPLPKGCRKRCKPCRAEVCAAVCEFEAYCPSGPCAEAMGRRFEQAT